MGRYLDILVDLLLVRRLEPWHSNAKKRLIKSPRYYIRDSGIVHRLLGISTYHALGSHPVLGKSWLEKPVQILGLRIDLLYTGVMMSFQLVMMRVSFLYLEL